MFFIKIMVTVLVLAATFVASAETCYYRYGDVTKNSDEAFQWSQAGDKVLRQACGTTPPMVPPGPVSVQQNNSTTNNRTQHTSCQQGTEPIGRNQNGGEICAQPCPQGMVHAGISSRGRECRPANGHYQGGYRQPGYVAQEHNVGDFVAGAVVGGLIGNYIGRRHR